jgi:hypothetical protein
MSSFGVWSYDMHIFTVSFFLLQEKFNFIFWCVPITEKFRISYFQLNEPKSFHVRLKIIFWPTHFWKQQSKWHTLFFFFLNLCVRFLEKWNSCVHAQPIVFLFTFSSYGWRLNVHTDTRFFGFFHFFFVFLNPFLVYVNCSIIKGISLFFGKDKDQFNTP